MIISKGKKIYIPVQDYLLTYRDRIQAVTAEQVLQVSLVVGDHEEKLAFYAEKPFRTRIFRQNASMASLLGCNYSNIQCKGQEFYREVCHKRDTFLKL